MRLKIECALQEPQQIPYNYNYPMQNVVYSLIRKSSPQFSEFLHNTGFVEDNRPFKLFTFSKLFFADAIKTEQGFSGVTAFKLIFSTPIKSSYEHLVLGIFAKQHFTIYFSQSQFINVQINSVESLPEAEIAPEMRFLTLSPIVSSTNIDQEGKYVQHYLDYMNPDEREKFVSNLQRNLLRKYRVVHEKDFVGSPEIEFAFDLDYILKRQGKIRKNIRFKKDKDSGRYSCIIGMEAPFTIKADPELIQIGYQCGFGEKNSAGFGMVEKIM